MIIIALFLLDLSLTFLISTFLENLSAQIKNSKSNSDISNNQNRVNTASTKLCKTNLQPAIIH